MECDRPMESEYVSVKFDEYQADASKRYNRDIEAIAHSLKQSHYPLNGRYVALALTKLEEAAMFINKAIAHNKK
ncbi:MAG: hypothetical protein IMF01_09555 [Proteobacteria bacterium]|nr:hypothetical protein [Pseudomonadota bacterium]